MYLHLINSFPCITFFLSFSLIYLLESCLKPDSLNFHYTLPGYSHFVFVDSLWQKKARRGLRWSDFICP